MLICLEEGCPCLHHQLLQYIKLSSNDNAKEILQRITNPAEHADGFGRTFLHYSIEYENCVMVEYLIEKGCNVNAQDKYGVTPLMRAVRIVARFIMMKPKIIDILLNNNADIFLCDFNGSNTIEHSFDNYVTLEKFCDEGGFRQYVRDKPCYAYLVESWVRGVSIKAMRDEHRLIFMKLIDKVNKHFLTDKEATMQLLLNANNVVKLACVAACNVELASLILKNNNQKIAHFHESKLGLTALHCASIFGKIDNVKLLLEEYKVNVDVLDENRVTPLMLAVKTNQVEVVDILLKNNADIFFTDNDQNSALQRSLYTKAKLIPGSVTPYSWPIMDMVTDKVNEEFFTDKEKIKKLFLNANIGMKFVCAVYCNVEVASFIIKDTDYAIDSRECELRLTALQWAINLAKPDNIKLLIECGASINVGRTSLLHNYTFNLQYVDEKSEILKILLKLSSSIDIENCLEHLLEFGSKPTVRTVLHYGIEFHKPHRHRPVQVILMSNDYLEVNDIIELGVNIDANLFCPISKQSVLIVEVRRGNLRNIEFLLKHGADVNFIPEDGVSSLMNAFMYCFYGNAANIIELLLQYGADAQIMCKPGKNLINYCLQYDQKDGYMIKPILTHLAMLATIDQSLLIESTLCSIEADELCKSHFDLCLRQLDNLKNIIISDTVTLFELLCKNEKFIVRYAHSQQFIDEFNCKMKNMSDLMELYYVNRLHRRVEKAIERAEIERILTEIIEVSTGKLIDEQHLVIEKIMNYTL